MCRHVPPTEKRCPCSWMQRLRNNDPGRVALPGETAGYSLPGTDRASASCCKAWIVWHGVFAKLRNSVLWLQVVWVGPLPSLNVQTNKNDEQWRNVVSWSWEVNYGATQPEQINRALPWQHRLFLGCTWLCISDHICIITLLHFLLLWLRPHKAQCITEILRWLCHLIFKW